MVTAGLARAGAGGALAAVLACSSAGAAPAAEVPASRPGKGVAGSVRVEYQPPKDPRHRELADSLKKRHALEPFAEVLGTIRLPKPLTLSLQGCDGESNAWYSPSLGKVIFCYEFVADIVGKAPLADKVAGWVLLRTGRDTARRMLGGAAWMYLRDARRRAPEEGDFADVHGLDA